MRVITKPFNRATVLIVAFLFVGLSACGFQFRGTNLQALQNASIYVQSSNANLIAAEVRRQLTDADVKTVSKVSEADYIVTLSNENFRSKVLSVSPTTGKVEEYEVTYNAMLDIASKNESSKINSGPVSAERDYTFDQGAVLGKVEEETVLRNDITRQAAESVLRRLRAAVQ